MDFDTFSAGVEPGALRSKNDIKLLICYLLSRIDSGLTKNDVIEVLQENNLANYFDAADAFSELLISKNIECCDKENYTYKATQRGELISEQLDTILPVTIRQKAISSANALLARGKIEKENRVYIEPNSRGYSVSCHISDGDIDLMSFSLYVPDITQANLVKKHFHDNPEMFYRCMIALATKNKDLSAEVLREIISKNK